MSVSGVVFGTRGKRAWHAWRVGIDTTNLERLDMRPEGNIETVDILMQAGNVVFDYLLPDSKGRSRKFGDG